MSNGHPTSLVRYKTSKTWGINVRVYLLFIRYHNGEEIYSDSRIKIGRDAKRIENYSLTITLIQKEDGGEYEVRATNERGTAVTKSLVTVLGKNLNL